MSLTPTVLTHSDSLFDLTKSEEILRFCLRGTDSKHLSGRRICRDLYLDLIFESVYILHLTNLGISGHS